MTERDQQTGRAKKMSNVFQRSDCTKRNNYKKLFVIGDSISMHYGPLLKKFLSGKMVYGRKGEGSEFGDINDVSDVNGGDSACVRAYLSQICEAGFSTDILLINCGLHDIKTQNGSRQVAEPDYRANLSEIIRLAKGGAKQMVWVRTTPIKAEIHNRLCQGFSRFEKDIEAYNSIADEMMTAAGIPMIDLYAFTAGLECELFCDHVHFHDEVKMLQAAFIAGYLLAKTE